MLIWLLLLLLLLLLSQLVFELLPSVGCETIKLCLRCLFSPPRTTVAVEELCWSELVDLTTTSGTALRVMLLVVDEYSALAARSFTLSLIVVFGCTNFLTLYEVTASSNFGVVDVAKEFCYFRWIPTKLSLLLFCWQKLTPLNAGAVLVVVDYYFCLLEVLQVLLFELSERMLIY